MEATLELTLYEAEFVEFILSSPTLEQIANYHLSDTADERLNDLLEANQQGTITPEGETELKAYDSLEHFITMIKISAYEKIAQK